jgi:hypothetical protein
MTARVPRATANVGHESSGTCVTIEATSRKKPSLWIWMPSSLGNWSATITKPTPALNPVSTGSEMKLARKPKRRMRAAMSIKPTSSERVADATRGLSPGSALSASPIAVAHRIAIGVVVLTLSTRELPRTAYTAIGTKAANRPACTGNCAMVA